MYTYQKAFTFNKQANDYALQMRYSQAIIYYKKSLSLYLSLAKQNPLEHGLAIAHIFSNLAIIYLNLKQRKKSQIFHQNSLKMHRAMARVKPNIYAIEFIYCLIDGVRYLEEHTLTLYEAEIVLNQIKQVHEKEKLVYVIRKLHLLSVEN